VPKQVISLWIAGVEPRKINYLQKIACYFGMTIDQLCFDGPASLQEEIAQNQKAERWVPIYIEGRMFIKADESMVKQISFWCAMTKATDLAGVSPASKGVANHALANIA